MCVNQMQNKLKCLAKKIFNPIFSIFHQHLLKLILLLCWEAACLFVALFVWLTVRCDKLYNKYNLLYPIVLK